MTTQGHHHLTCQDRRGPSPGSRASAVQQPRIAPGARAVCPRSRSGTGNGLLSRKALHSRLSPTRTQEHTLLFVLRRCRHLSNSALEQRKARFTRCAARVWGTPSGPQSWQRSPAYQDISRQVLQDALRRLDKAFAAFFRRIRNGETPGYPRLEARGPLRLVHLSAIGFCAG